MEQQLSLKLRNLVDRGFFNKSVQAFGLSRKNPEELEPQRLYFIKIRQPGQWGMAIDTIVMYKNTYTKPNVDDVFMSFRQYYFRKFRLTEDIPYNPLQETDKNIDIAIRPELYIVDITDMISKESSEIDKLNVAFLSSEQVNPNLIRKLPYGLGPNNGQVTGTNEKGLVASYLGGKKHMKKKSKSTRKKRSKRRRRHNKTKK